MKKVTLVLVALFLMTIALSSCKKDYTCVCSATNFPFSKVTKKDAQDKCSALSITYSAAGGCSLK